MVVSESVALFEQIVNYDTFDGIDFILFLNKSDLLGEKIHKSRLADYFPDFTGPDNDLLAAQEFIQTMYVSRADPGRVKAHCTTATNTENIHTVFEGVRQLLVQRFLKQMGISLF